MPNIVIQIQADGGGTEAALAAVREEMEQVRHAAEEGGSAMAEFGERAKRALEYAGIYLGIQEIKEGLKELVEGSMELAENLGHLSQQTGISAENLSVLKFAADSSGVSFDLMTAGFRKLSQAMVHADSDNKAAEQAFSRLGITQAEVKGHTEDLWGMLSLVADKFKEMPDGALKNAEATTLLGKAGTQLIPILNQGSEGLEEFRAKASALGIVIDEQGIAKMEDMKRALATLKGEAQGAGLGFTEGLEPGITGAANALVHASEGGHAFQTIGEVVGREVLSMAAQFAWLKEQIMETVAEYMQWEAHINAFGDRIDADTGFTKTQRARGSERLKQDIDESHEATKIMKDATEDYQNIKAELSKAMADYGKAAQGEGHRGGAGDSDISGLTKTKKTPGDNGIDRARTALADAMAAEQVAAVKGSTEAAMAALDDQHKQFLISDDAYYAEKLKLQDRAFDAQLAALRTQQEQLQALEARQQNDKKLHRDKTGQSAEELATAKQLVELQGKMAEVEGQKARAAEQYRQAEAAGTNASQLEILKQAAEIEKDRNSGIAARLALLRAENEIELQKAAVNYGANSPQYQQLQQMEALQEAKLRFAEMDSQIAESERENATKVKAIHDEVLRGLLSKKKAQEEINALNEAEAALLRQILPMYEQQAKLVGGQAAGKVDDVQKQIGDLSTPTKKGVNVGDELSKSVTSSLDQMASAALKGKLSFKDMADSMIGDIERIAIKLLEEKFLTSFFNSMFGGSDGGDGGSGGGGGGGFSFPGFASGGRPTGPSIVGEAGPELFVPDSPGTVVNNSTLKAIAGGSAAGAAPQVGINITNNSSQQLNARETGRSYDHDSRQFVVHTVLEDLQQGGAISAALGGGR